ncbi:hypothetical protein SDC9_177013 [bioreactor metagenome]|uniref:Uncharacterized protein n=1 Tax=bioreactor metagenome TaxID=1076179 RepID=A0A645GTD9_9ZZZZ
MQPVMVHNTAATPADDTFTVCVIYHEHNVVAVGDLVKFIQRGDITVHAEDAISDEQTAPVGIGILADHAFQVSGVGVGKTHNTCP